MNSVSPLRPASPPPGPAVERATATLSFDADVLAGYAKEILAPGGPRAIRMRETGGKRLSAVFVARHEDVVDVLTDEAEFSVSHYAKLFGAASPKDAYLLMRNPSPERTERYAILNAAKVHTPWFAADPTVVTPATRDLARRVVQTLIDAFRCRAIPAFDVIGEYGGFAPYLIAAEVFGLPGPRRFDLLGWLVTQGMTLPKFRPFTPETGPYLTQAAWAQLVLAQLFVVFDNGAPLITLAARWAEARFRAHIHDRLHGEPSRDANPAGADLLSALRQVRPEFPHVSDAHYEAHVLYLMLELVGTALTVPPTAFTSLIDAEVARSDGRLVFEGLTPHNADAYVDEALRLAGPTGHLLRNATRRIAFAGLQLDEGEYVCALAAAAERDVPDGDQLCPFRPQSDNLHFGPEGGPHRCFGRPIALPMLGEMLLGLQSLHGLKDAGDVTRVGGVESRRVVTFDRKGDPASLTTYYPRRPAIAGEAGP